MTQHLRSTGIIILGGKALAGVSSPLARRSDELEVLLLQLRSPGALSGLARLPICPREQFFSYIPRLLHGS
jgi:hypothetical protein